MPQLEDEEEECLACGDLHRVLCEECGCCRSCCDCGDFEETEEDED
jgi:hypothetical protein